MSYITEEQLDQKLDKFLKDLIDYMNEDMKAQNLELEALRKFNEDEHKLFHNKFHKVDQYILENPLVQDKKQKT